MSVDGRDYASGNETIATLPGGRVGHRNRRLESVLAGWLGQAPAVLFGDGAGSVVMSSCMAKDDELMGFILRSESDTKLDLTLDNENVTFSQFKNQISPNFVKMNGKAIYQFALRVVPEITNQILDKVNLSIDQIDCLVLHQANQRIIDAVSERLNIPKSKVLSNIQNVGNTSAASIPLAIVDGIKSKRIKSPCKMLLIGFGAGLTWGASIIDCNIN